MYLSELIDKSIKNKSGELVGKAADIIVTNLNSPLPAVTGFVVSRPKYHKVFFIPIHDIDRIEKKLISLTTDTINMSPFERRDEEVLLSRHILDKQIVDVKERHLTRINDIELSPSHRNLFLKSVDVSFRAILNRLGFPTKGLFFKYNPILWQNIQFLGVDLPVRVKIDYDRLESLHPADIARFIFKGPGYREGTQIIESLEEEIAADVVESLPIELQTTIIENMSAKAAARIISEIESHHAADLLAELDPKKTDEILASLKDEQVRVVKQLITYPPTTAGAFMKVEFFTAPQTMTVEELYTKLRTTAPLPEFLLYIYITESATSKKLVGIVSVWELFSASPRERMESIMVTSLIPASPYDTARSVLKKMTQYDLSAIPVINRHRHIIGIVTLSHAIKLLIPKNWQTRVNWRE